MVSFKLSMGAKIVLLLLVATATSFTEAQDLGCAQKLVPCQPYLNQTVAPPASCCSSIKDAVTKDLVCLCNIYKNPSLLASLNINVTQAVQLTGRCNVPVNINECTVAQSPGTTPGVPGNHGSRMSWTGFSSLLLLCMSSLFY